LRLSLHTTIAAEIGDGRLAILDVAGLPEIRQWFVVHPATKRMMPAASSLRDFLVARRATLFAERKTWPARWQNACGERQSLCQEEVMIIFVFRVKAWQGHPCSRRVLCSLLLTLEKRKVSVGIH
jgi:hypothetical protein